MTKEYGPQVLLALRAGVPVERQLDKTFAERQTMVMAKLYSSCETAWRAVHRLSQECPSIALEV